MKKGSVPDEEEYKQVDKFIVTNKFLGKGSFGIVYRGFFEKDHLKIVAVKVTPLEKISNDLKFLELLKREIEIMQSIDHPNVVRMYAATRTSRNLYMFLEYCRDGDIKELLNTKKGHLSESEALLYFRQIIEGFKILYHNRIIHRDIKPANILLHEGVAKITDFGFARVIEGDMEKSGQFSKVGTPLYMSPQILNDQKFSAKTDIWSLGMMLYEMLYGKTPWNADSPYGLFMNIKNIALDFPEKPIRSEEVKELLKLMLIVEDKERISWLELFSHPLCKLDTKGIQANLEKLEQEKDCWTKTVAMNNLYVQNNRVMGFKKNEELTQIFTKEMKNKEKTDNWKKNQKEEVIDAKDYGKIINRQDNDQNERKIIIKVDSFFSHERNIAIFINYTSTLLFNFYSMKKAPIIENLFFRVFFMFQKLQIMIFKNIIQIMEGKKELGVFTKPEWSTYCKSPEFALTHQAIKTDMDFMIPYFVEVGKRTKEVVEKTFAKEESQVLKTALKTFSQLINDKFEMGDNFEIVFKETLNEFISYLKEFLLKKQQVEKDLLLILRLSLICLNRNSEFQWDINEGADFHKLYENYETMDERALYEELLKILNLNKNKNLK